VSIILGSRSFGRGKVMSFFSLPFEQIPFEFDEESIPFLGDPAEYVRILSYKKSEVFEGRSDQIILTADTTVYCDGNIYNKPRDREEAESFLLQLQGKWHTVFTGVTVRKNQTVFTEAEETRLLLNPLSLKQIKQFHECFCSLFSAGGYEIEQAGSLIVSKIDGCYYNVLGLPVNLVRKLFLRFGIDLWDFLKKVS
jgi:septum formation protein